MLEPRSRSNFTLQLDLSPYQIEIIEEKRRGGDLYLRLGLKILSASIREEGLFDGFSDETVYVRMPPWGEDLKIPQSEWVSMLGEMSYRRFRVFEIPIPEPPKETPIESSLKYVKEAIKSFNTGDYDDVLGNCRNAIEEFEKADLNFQEILKSESKAEKFNGIIRKVKDYSNLGVHPGVKINRKDAEMILHFTLSTIRFLGEALQVNEKEFLV